MSNILLIGAGQIGSRHLQGLVRTLLNLNITVVDPSGISLSKAKERWVEVGGDQSPHKISWFRALPKNIKSFDIAIVATSSKDRAKLINQVVSSVNVRYWVLEKVLAQSSQELELINSITSKAEAIWVNTPRRLMIFYEQLKSKFYDQGPLRIKKTGGLWGLACNSIHFIDLIAWWTSESLLSVNTSRLDPIWFKAKRSGYFEVSGELEMRFSGGSKLTLQSNSNIIGETMNVKLPNKRVWKIDESNVIASSSKKDILSGKFELQSEMTGLMVTKILIEGTCNLPHLKESLKQHAIFLEAMLSHWNTFNKSNDKAVPIT